MTKEKTEASRIKLSVCMTNLNHGHLLNDSLGNVTRQMYEQNFPGEVLIIDDCSSDNSVNEIIKIDRKYPGIISFKKNKKNMGVNHNQNRSFKSAKGDLIFSLSADDQVEDNFIKFIAEEIDISKNIGVYYFAPIIIDKVNNTFCKIRPFGDIGRLYKGLGLASLFAKTGGRLYGHSALINRKLASEHGFYEEDVLLFSDWYLVHKIALLYGVVFFNQGFCKYFVYSNSYSSDEIKRVKALYALAKRLTSEGPNFADLFFRSGLHTGNGFKGIFIYAKQLKLFKYLFSFGSLRIMIKKAFHKFLKAFKKKLIFESVQK